MPVNMRQKAGCWDPSTNEHGLNCPVLLNEILSIALQPILYGCCKLCLPCVMLLCSNVDTCDGSKVPSFSQPQAQLLAVEQFLELLHQWLSASRPRQNSCP